MDYESHNEGFRAFYFGHLWTLRRTAFSDNCSILFSICLYEVILHASAGYGGIIPFSSISLHSIRLVNNSSVFLEYLTIVQGRELVRFLKIFSNVSGEVEVSDTGLDIPYMIRTVLMFELQYSSEVFNMYILNVFSILLSVFCSVPYCFVFVKMFRAFEKRTRTSLGILCYMLSEFIKGLPTF